MIPLSFTVSLGLAAVLISTASTFCEPLIAGFDSLTGIAALFCS
jgi:hypothetical protein